MNSDRETAAPLRFAAISRPVMLNVELNRFAETTPHISNYFGTFLSAHHYLFDFISHRFRSISLLK